MADKTITFSKSIVAQKELGIPGIESYITQLSKPFFIKGVSTKKCPNVLYSIDGIHFTEETAIGDDHVLSMAVVPFQIGGNNINSPVQYNLTGAMINKSFSYILGGRDINEDINIDDPISTSTGIDGNGAYRYLLQYLAKNKDKIEWDTGDLFSALDADKQDSFGGSDFITDTISVSFVGASQQDELYIAKQSDANGSILKPTIKMGEVSSNAITIKQSPYFFLYPDACPNPDESQKLIIDNFWRGGGLLVSRCNHDRNKDLLMLYIFAVS